MPASTTPRCTASSVTWRRCDDGSRLQALVENTLKTLEILPWSEACARVYGRLRAELARSGKPLAAMDLLIASHALSEGCALVTEDQAFAHVADLQLEAW
ncbi:MAG: PIN domain-containing protein [Cyanobacteriota bacterium]|nr:PIN domain-containing protein [Cyanobacteriota bacterium]